MSPSIFKHMSLRLAAVLILGLPLLSQATQPPQAGSELEVLWTAQVGQTTFRTTMIQHKDQIIIGTHGKSLTGLNEADDGVYLIQAASGKIERFIKTPGSGDLDVGGIALANGQLVFSTDNGQLVATTLEGKLRWQAQLNGQVRPSPALGDLNGDGVADAVVGDEEGVLWALDGESGRTLWKRDTEANEYDNRGFVAAAALGDLDGDGQLDVVAGARDGVLRSFKGKNGQALWKVKRESGIHASPALVDLDRDGQTEVLASWSYGDMAILDSQTGLELWFQHLELETGGIEGLFASPIPVAGKPGVVVTGSAWWDGRDGVVAADRCGRAFKSIQGRVTASAVVADLDGDGRAEAIIGTEKGLLLAVHLNGQVEQLARLKGPIEAPAMLADVDGNGTLEILVASNDGLLTCFSTGARTKALIGRFRGPSPSNRGHLGRQNLDWTLRGGWSCEGDEPIPHSRYGSGRGDTYKSPAKNRPAPSEALQQPEKQEPEDDSAVADYFAMPGTAGSVYMITAGVAPEDAPGYKMLSAVNMSVFPEAEDVVDVGFNGEVFSYRQTPNGTSWGILGMGPSLRIGRLFINMDINLISFRHQSNTHTKGWLPGLSGRVYLPLVNHGSHSIWSIFLPTPAAGFELWFNDKLDYDQIGFWVGFAWIGYVGDD